MKLERRFIIVMFLCLLFIGLLTTPIGQRMIDAYVNIPHDDSFEAFEIYFTDVGGRGTTRDKDAEKYFAEAEYPPLRDMAFFYKKKYPDDILRGQLVLDDNSLETISNDELYQVLTYGYDRIINQTGKKFEACDLRIGYDEKVLTKLELHNDLNTFTLTDTYNTIPGYHKIGSLDTDALETQLSDDLSFVVNVQLIQLPLSSSHIIAKAYVNNDFTPLKQKRLESLIKEMTEARHLSVYYSKYGKRIQQTIADDPTIEK